MISRKFFYNKKFRLKIFHNLDPIILLPLLREEFLEMNTF